MKKNLLIIALILNVCSCAILERKLYVSRNGASRGCLIVGAENAALFSNPFGTKWVRIDVSNDNDTTALYAATLNTPQPMAIGVTGQIYRFDKKSQRWVLGIVSNHRDWLYDVQCDTQICVAIGSANKIFTLNRSNIEDGKGLKVTISPEIVTSVNYAESKFIVAGNNGYILSSSTGGTWQVESSMAKIWLSQIKYLNNQYLVTGDNGAIYTSSNLQVWNNISLKESENPDLTSIAYGNDRYVVIGQNGNIFYSKDNGMSWQSAKKRYTISKINDIVFYKGLFIAITGDGMILTSDDGYEWDSEQVVNVWQSLYFITCTDD